MAEFLLQGESLLLPTAHAFFDKTAQELVGKHNLSNDETKVSVTGNEELLDIVVDEYLAEVAGESIDVPDEANDILDWVFGSEELEYDEEYDEENIFEEEQSDSQ